MARVASLVGTGLVTALVVGPALGVAATFAHDVPYAGLASAFVTPVPVGLKIAPLALALPLFAVLYKLLRARFADARRERVFAGKR